MTKRASQLAAVLVAGGMVGRVAADMDLGTNFRDLGWHRPGDCFRDFKNVSAADAWNPQFLIGYYPDATPTRARSRGTRPR